MHVVGGEPGENSALVLDGVGIESSAVLDVFWFPEFWIVMIEFYCRADKSGVAVRFMIAD